MEAGALANSDQENLLRQYDHLFPSCDTVAVRSSAVAEDSATDSFAGQLDTYLHVARTDLIDRVIACFESVSSTATTTYREVRRQQHGTPTSAVIVQEMVDAEVSGVLFTANPVTGKQEEAILTAGYGLGEGVVGDLVGTDTWHVDLRNGTILKRVIGTKDTRVQRDVGSTSGTAVHQVPESLQSQPILSDEQIRNLTALGRKIDEEFETPQDIEWAVDRHGTIYVLQSRPITTLDQEQIFDNSNIVESYPGLSLPLTFSFARTSYEQTFRESSRTLGVPGEVLRKNRHVHENLVALIEGRIYYNILNWYALFVLVPGFESFLPAWEKALGLPAHHVRKSAPAPFFDRLRIVGRILYHFLMLASNVRLFRKRFDEVRESFYRQELGEQTTDDLLELYEDLARKLLAPFSITVVNDLFTQQFYDHVGRALEAWRLENPIALRNDLLCGEPGMESVEPVRSLLRLTDLIRGERRLQQLFESVREPGDVWTEAQKFEVFRGAARKHLDRYGDRTMQELKLETPSAEEQPEFIVTMIRNYLRGGQEIDSLQRREGEIRDRAERRIALALRFQPLRRLHFSFLLHHCRRTVTNRENLRLIRSRAFGMVKRIFRAVGATFARERILEEPTDIFFLTVEEIAGEIRGTGTSRNLQRLVGQRKLDYKAFADQNPPSRIVSKGPKINWQKEVQPPTPPKDGMVFVGTGCSPGQVTAKAKVLRSADVAMKALTIDGEILIAPMTDPGWVFLMVAAGGLVVEKGSILSHTAIIGRELGIPTVVGLKNATSLIQDGQTVTIDGTTGRVEVNR